MRQAQYMQREKWRSEVSATFGGFFAELVFGVPWVELVFCLLRRQVARILRSSKGRGKIGLNTAKTMTYPYLCSVKRSNN